MKLLIVDDNKYVVYGLERQLQWNVLGIDEVFGCYSVYQAKEILSREWIDFMICDIEMPGENGFALLRWIEEQGMDLDTVLLTSYAEFHYAQEAVHYHCFAYLLKPIGNAQLEDVFLRLIQQRLTKRKLKELVQFESEWSRRQEIVREMFWWDVVEETPSATEEELKARLQKEHLPYHWNDCFQAVQICFDPQTEEANWSRDLLGFCCENALSELIQSMPASLECVCHSGYFQFTAIFRLEHASASGQLQETCILDALKQFLTSFLSFYHSGIRCYVSDPCPIRSLETHLRRLEAIQLHKKYPSGSIVEEREYAGWDEQKLSIPSQHGLRVERIQDYITAHLDTVTRNEISEQFYLSPNYLSKFFHREAGIPLSEYIQKKRMELAKQLLRQEDIPISQVAEQSGYPSFAHFSKQFKKLEGITPNEYRKKKRHFK